MPWGKFDATGAAVIPKIIIQTWKTDDLPQREQAFADGWKRLNPGFDYRLFDDAACEGLIADAAPEFLPDYRAFPFPVMRADFFRYAAIWALGGVYADVDMECLRPIAPLLELGDAILSVEVSLTAARQRELGYARPYQIANCVFAARPRHPFMRAAMERCIELARARSGIERRDIEDITGPRMLTRLFYESPPAGVAVLRQIFLMPPRHYPAVWPIGGNFHARHHFLGSWKEHRPASLRRRWIERDLWPTPFPSAFVDPRPNGG